MLIVLSSDIAHSVDVFARTLCGEDEGGLELGMAAVANVIINRVRHPRWWGHDVLSVCQAPWQFSCWNPGPDRDRIVALTDSNAYYRLAVDVATRAIQGHLPDLTNGADSYYAKYMIEPPSGVRRAVVTFENRSHRFYRVDLAAPSGDPEAPNVSVMRPVLTAPAISEADRLMAAEQVSLNKGVPS